MKFHVGQKVVCVDISTPTHRRIEVPASIWLAVGCVYTVRWVGEAPYPADRSLGLCVRLQEIVRPDSLWDDYPFLAARFRPVVERKTDITVFTEILRKATKPARTPAFSSKEL